MMEVRVPLPVLDRTLTFLREAGAERQAEGVVLWLGARNGKGVSVHECYVPEQEAEYDFFRIPPPAMAALLHHLGETRMFVAAQVHSHPREAFHSRADDKWAIVRHVGALSVVVPNFATKTSAATFHAHAAVFQLDAADRWQRVPIVGLIKFAP